MYYCTSCFCAHQKSTCLAPRATACRRASTASTAQHSAISHAQAAKHVRADQSSTTQASRIFPLFSYFFQLRSFFFSVFFSISLRTVFFSRFSLLSYFTIFFDSVSISVPPILNFFFPDFFSSLIFLCFLGGRFCITKGSDMFIFDLFLLLKSRNTPSSYQ